MGRLAGLGGTLGVGRAVEVDEEVEVGPDDETGEQVSVSLVRAAVLGEGVVVGDGARVGDEDDDELDDLDGRDVLLPPDVLTGANDHDEVVPVPITEEKSSNGVVSACSEVRQVKQMPWKGRSRQSFEAARKSAFVALQWRLLWSKRVRTCNVHGDVDEGVERGGNPLHRDGVLEADPAEEESHRVMVEVQEAEGGLAQDDEDSIEQLVELGEVEDVQPEVESSLSSGFALRVAEQTFMAVGLSKQGQKNIQGVSVDQERALRAPK